MKITMMLMITILSLFGINDVVIEPSVNPIILLHVAIHAAIRNLTNAV